MLRETLAHKALLCVGIVLVVGLVGWGAFFWLLLVGWLPCSLRRPSCWSNIDPDPHRDHQLPHRAHRAVAARQQIHLLDGKRSAVGLGFYGQPTEEVCSIPHGKRLRLVSWLVTNTFMQFSTQASRIVYPGMTRRTRSPAPSSPTVQGRARLGRDGGRDAAGARDEVRLSDEGASHAARSRSGCRTAPLAHRQRTARALGEFKQIRDELVKQGILKESPEKSREEQRRRHETGAARARRAAPRRHGRRAPVPCRCRRRRRCGSRGRRRRRPARVADARAERPALCPACRRVTRGCRRRPRATSVRHAAGARRRARVADDAQAVAARVEGAGSSRCLARTPLPARRGGVHDPRPPPSRRAARRARPTARPRPRRPRIAAARLVRARVSGGVELAFRRFDQWTRDSAAHRVAMVGLDPSLHWRVCCHWSRVSRSRLASSCRLCAGGAGLRRGCPAPALDQSVSVTVCERDNANWAV